MELSGKENIYHLSIPGPKDPKDPREVPKGWERQALCDFDDEHGRNCLQGTWWRGLDMGRYLETWLVSDFGTWWFAREILGYTHLLAKPHHAIYVHMYFTYINLYISFLIYVIKLSSHCYHVPRIWHHIYSTYVGHTQSYMDFYNYYTCWPFPEILDKF